MGYPVAMQSPAGRCPPPVSVLSAFIVLNSSSLPIHAGLEAFGRIGKGALTVHGARGRVHHRGNRGNGRGRGYEVNRRGRRGRRGKMRAQHGGYKGDREYSWGGHGIGSPDSYGRTPHESAADIDSDELGVHQRYRKRYQGIASDTRHPTARGLTRRPPQDRWTGVDWQARATIAAREA